MARPRAGRGFTLVELITVMILLGILSVVVLPRLEQGAMFGAVSFRDRVASSLRYAQKTAVSHRRLVCGTVAADRLTLTVATAFGDAACANALAGSDGGQPAALSPNATVTLTAVPAGPLYFQPSGAVSSDGAGAVPTDFALTVTDQTAIAVNGATGHVE
jgi:MSHA pilin protein MshC